MLKLLDSPDSVLAVEGSGKIESADYERVLEPAIKAMIEDRDEVRLVYVLGDEFAGYSFGAAWEDSKLGLSDISKWKRCAIATNHDWLRHGVSFFGWMMPGQVRVFDASDVEAAIAWAGEGC